MGSLDPGSSKEDTYRSAPRLETERLVLRGFEENDLSALALLWADPVVTRYLGGKPLTREETWRKALAGAAQWALLGFGYWLAIDRATTSLVGHLGFADFKRGLVPEMEGAPELGYVFAASVHGSGVAGEACRAALRWADVRLGVPTWAIIAPTNGPSCKLADRLGFQRVLETTYHNAPTLVLRRPAKG